MKTIYRNFCVFCAFCVTLTACSDFLEEQVPQATLTQDEVKDAKYIDNVLISAYAGLVSIEDMNASFSLWNYDTRSDDAYVGGASFSDGEPFHRLEKGTGVMTQDWPFSSIWNKLYKYLSRVSLSGRDEVPACLWTLPVEAFVQKDSFCQQAEHAGGRL